MKRKKEFKSIAPDSFKNHVRTHFLEIAARICPEPFEELRKDALPLFSQAGMNQLMNPIYQSGFSLTDFVNGTDKTNPKVIELRDDLTNWQERWCLIENKDSDKWVLIWLIKNVLSFWSTSSKVHRKMHLFRPLGKNKPMPLPPSFNPPDFFERNPITKSQSIKKRAKDYIKMVLDEYREKLEAYCREVEEYTAENGWMAEQDISVRDLIWTAKSQIADLDYSEIANTGKIDFSEKIKSTDLINPLELTRDDFEIYAVEPSTVQRVVENTLKILELQPRKKKVGRRSKKRQDEINKQLMD
ncbi:MAG TPA: hypothetical protein VF540_10090 [Segetibacter sp.]|jgi:hypothetical protein